MDLAVCTHQAAREAMEAGDPERALRVVGPMMEDNPADLTAWRLAALATLALGDRPGAIKNLRSCALAQAQDGNPIQAIAAAKEIEALGEDVEELVARLAELYGAGSERLKELDLAPPPLPAARGTAPWGPKLDRDAVISRGRDAMAMAWGAALTLDDRKADLPFVPLLSSLAAPQFAQLVGRLERLQAAEGAVVVEQGSAGDAMYMVSEGSVAVSHRPATGEPVELARLGPGAFFGEMALVSSAPRAAEVSAAEPSVLLRADKEEMEGLAAGAPVVGDVLIAFCHARMLENLVRVSPVLAPVPPLKRPEVIARFETDFRAAGEVIIAEGQEGPGLFLVVSGGVRVVRAEGNDRVLLASLGPGDLFGEIYLLMRKPSTATVIAQQNTALLFLPRAQFESATSEFPELLKGAYDIAVSRENRNNSIMGKAALDASDLILV